MADTVITTVEGIPVYQAASSVRVYYTGHGRIDDDGSGGNKWHDPDFQSDTTLHHSDGTPLDANTEIYFVVPPQIIDGVDPVVMGCQGYVTYNSRTVAAVVGDQGPDDKCGEMSSACAQALGLDPNGNDGGVDAAVVFYELYPGIPATVGNITYQLQSS